MIDAIVADPRLVGAVVPLGVGLLTAALLQVGGARRGSGFAMVGAWLALLLVYVLIEGLPPLFAVTAKQKLFWLAVAGGIAGMAAQSGHRGAVERVLLVLLPAAGVLWLGERQWLRGPDTGFVVVSTVLWLGGAAILLRLRATGSAAHGFAGGAQLVVAAIGLALVALIGASASLATLAGAIAAGVGGVLLLDYGIFLATGSSTGLGPIGRLGVAMPLVLVAAILVLFAADVSDIAVALLSLVFLSGRIALRFGGRASRSRWARMAEPVRVTVVAAIPAAIAVGVALFQADMTGYP